MTFTPRAIEAAAMACYEHEPLEVDDFVEIPWDGISQGTRDRFMHKARATLSAALAVDGVAMVPSTVSDDNLLDRLTYFSGWKCREVPGVELSKTSLLIWDAIDEIRRLRAMIAASDREERR